MTQEINADFSIKEQQEINANFSIDVAIRDKYFVFEQAESSAIWEIHHNLNKKASVTVVDEYDRVVIPYVQYIDDNNIRLEFNFAFKGKAYLN